MSTEVKKLSPKKWEENTARFKELVLYLSQKCATDPKFNTLKLNKLMFFSDFYAYAVLGEPITGFEYQKLEKGPAPRRMPEIKKEMVSDKSLAQQPLPMQPWRKTVNLRSPDLSVFTPQQVSLIDAIIDALRDADGDELSDVSHRMPCWILPDLKGTIPYEMVFLSNEQPTAVDIERGKAVAAELSLLEPVCA